MALTYDQIRNAAVDGAILGRLHVAMAKHAMVVALEDGGTASHAQRLALAKLVLQGGISQGMAFAVALESVIAGGSGSVTDANLDTAVAGAWTALSLALE